jgi:hypothetical protein
LWIDSFKHLRENRTKKEYEKFYRKRKEMRKKKN